MKVILKKDVYECVKALVSICSGSELIKAYNERKLPLGTEIAYEIDENTFYDAIIKGFVCEMNEKEKEIKEYADEIYIRYVYPRDEKEKEITKVEIKVISKVMKILGIEFNDFGGKEI